MATNHEMREGLRQMMADWDAATPAQREAALKALKPIKPTTPPAIWTRPITVSAVQAKAIAKRCEDAYSFDRISNWAAIAVMLARRGLCPNEIEAFMRSKHIRWACDSSDKRYGHVTAKDVAAYADKHNALDQKELDQLVSETF